MRLDPAPDSGVGGLLESLRTYRAARRVLLDVLGIPASNRDPLAEFSERLVAALLEGELAVSRVQAGYDVIAPDGAKVQVRYLANPAGPWINEHHIRSLPGVDLYALVLFESFAVTAVLTFPADLTSVCALLGKRHPRQATELQFTRRNFESICSREDDFVEVGVRHWTFSGSSDQR